MGKALWHLYQKWHSLYHDSQARCEDMSEILSEDGSHVCSECWQSETAERICLEHNYCLGLSNAELANGENMEVMAKFKEKS
jgi:hypothetical protein